MRFFLIVPALFFFQLIHAQQSFQVNGRITDQSANPLQGATVQLVKISDSLQSNRILTDSTGRFLFRDIKPDSFRLSVSYVGFNEVTRVVKVDTADLTIDIMVTPSS
jgi:hypothetical protein